jgi:hypothetical protein
MAVAASACPARLVARVASLSIVCPRPTKALLLKMIVAGSSWGLALAAGLAVLRFRACGMICIDDVMWTTTAALVAGNLVFAPAVMLGADIRFFLNHQP